MTQLLAEIISIGDELTSGQRLDTNSQWISQQLGAIGVRVMYHSTVADDLEANIDVFRQAIDRADLVVSTGGLGPTADDLTRQSLASATGVELYEDAKALAYIQQLFSSRGREMPPKNVGPIGVNYNAGKRIAVMVRKPTKYGGDKEGNTFFDLDHIVLVLLHELTHIVRGPHDDVFWKLLDELNEEYEQLKKEGKGLSLIHI